MDSLNPIPEIDTPEGSYMQTVRLSSMVGEPQSYVVSIASEVGAAIAHYFTAVLDFALPTPQLPCGLELRDRAWRVALFVNVPGDSVEVRFGDGSAVELPNSRMVDPLREEPSQWDIPVGRLQEVVEILLHRVGQLVEQRDNFARELAALGSSHEEALARIDELEHLNEALRIETYRLDADKPDLRQIRRIAATIAAAALGLVSGVGQGVGTAWYNEARGVHDAAVVVTVKCDSGPSDPDAAGT
jgi:hypothetical protein